MSRIVEFIVDEHDRATDPMIGSHTTVTHFSTVVSGPRLDCRLTRPLTNGGIRSFCAASTAHRAAGALHAVRQCQIVPAQRPAGPAGLADSGGLRRSDTATDGAVKVNYRGQASYAAAKPPPGFKIDGLDRFAYRPLKFIPPQAQSSGTLTRQEPQGDRNYTSTTEHSASDTAWSVGPRPASDSGCWEGSDAWPQPHDCRTPRCGRIGSRPALTHVLSMNNFDERSRR